MTDRRAVDDLSIEELEQVLRQRKRAARAQRLQRFEDEGRRRTDLPLPKTGSHARPNLEAADQNTPKKRSFRDKLLLVIEFSAVLGLVGIMGMAALTLTNINKEAAEAQAEVIADIPTPSPTPLVSVVVLPSGHTPPIDGNSPQPNYDEVPEHLRPLVDQQQFPAIAAPTPAPGSAIRMRVPAIGVDAPVVQGDGWSQLQKGIGQHLGTANPGQTGNMVVSAHNDIAGEIFRYLDQLSEGDEIIIQTLNREYTYRVAFWHVVPPDQVSVMSPTIEPIVTLISCYPYLVDSDRIVVVAEYQP